MMADDGACLTGQLGRIGVIGGSEDYTGAPYFSAMASARLGCDMVGSFFVSSLRSFFPSSLLCLFSFT
jgi:NAD(P)H-hydrate repair Nnr-like enzyme with NAD(P)H-hydrate dehydratase domain